MSDSLVVGPPGVLAAWIHAFVREAASLAANAPEIRTLDRLDDAEFLGAGETEGDRIFLCNFPSPSLIAKVARGEIPTLALLDEPTDMVRFIMLQSKWPFVDVLRVCTLASTVNRALYGNSSALILHRGVEGNSSEVIDVILESVGIRMAPETLQDIKHRHTSGGSWASLEEVLQHNVKDWVSLTARSDGTSEDEVVQISKCLTPLIHYAFEANPPQVVWPNKLFLFGDNPNEPPPLVTELTGGARTIFYGPYLYLPPARYRVSFVLGFSSETKGMSFYLKVVQKLGVLTIAEVRCVAPGSGIFEGSFELEIKHSNEPVEVIFRNEEGAIEGRVAMAEVKFDFLESSVSSASGP